MYELFPAALLEAYDAARIYRDNADYVRLAHAPAVDLLHGDRSLEGNLGALYFRTHQGEVYGTDWIAPSRGMRSAVRETIEALKHGTLVHSCKNDGGINIVPPAGSGKKIQNIKTTFAGKPKSLNDSEFVLLNVLAKQLPDRTVGGKLSMITERIPCMSCTDVIAQFMDRYPGIAVTIGYLFDYETERRAHCCFLNDLPERDVQLVKLLQSDLLTHHFLAIDGDSPLMAAHHHSPEAFGRLPDGSGGAVPTPVGHEATMHLHARIAPGTDR